MIRVHPGMLRLVGLYCAFTDFCMGRKETERTDTERKKQQKNALLFNWAKCVWFIESVWHGNSQDGRLHGLQGLENVWSAEGIVTAPAALLESDIQLERAPGCSSWKRTFRRWAKSHQPNEGKLWKKKKKKSWYQETEKWSDALWPSKAEIHCCSAQYSNKKYHATLG